MKLHRGAAAVAYSIAKRLKKEGFIAYFAGGCVRDELMKKKPSDYDIATTATPSLIEKIFPKTIPVGRQFGVMIVVEKGKTFEVATFRKESRYSDGRHPDRVSYTNPEEDARRRDFTVNGLFYDPFKRKILDFVDGVCDIRRKTICAIGNPEERFQEDKLRLLRAVRFASMLDFNIEQKTYEAIKKNVESISQTSPERIRDELIKIFMRPGADKGLDLLSDTGLLRVILPEVEAMKGVEQPEQFHPEGDAFVHTRLLLRKLKKPSLVLVFSALFHDIGKPLTAGTRKGRKTFYEHAPIGAEMVHKIMRRLRFSNDEVEAVSECVENHMRFADVQRMRVGKLKQLIARPTFDDELELHRVDCEASHGVLDNYYFLKRKRDEFAKEDLKPKPLLNGHDLMDLGLDPGPGMKPILEDAFELQLEGRFKSKSDAVIWAGNRLRRKR